MPRKEPPLKILAARRQLLVMESDLNRAQLFEAVRDLKAEFQRTKQRLGKWGSMAATGAKLVTTVATARRVFSRRDGKRSWRSILYDGLSVGTSLWSLLHSNQRKPD